MGRSQEKAYVPQIQGSLGVRCAESCRDEFTAGVTSLRRPTLGCDCRSEPVMIPPQSCAELILGCILLLLLLLRKSGLHPQESRLLS